MDSSALIGFFVGTHNRTPFYRFPNDLLVSQTVDDHLLAFRAAKRSEATQQLNRDLAQ